MGFTSVDLTNCKLKKIWEYKNLESSKKQNLNLPCTKHYTESTKMKLCVGMPCCNLYAMWVMWKILWHFIKDLSACGFWYPYVMEWIPCEYHGTTVNGELYDNHELEGSIFLRYQFSTNWSTYVIQHQRNKNFRFFL